MSFGGKKKSEPAQEPTKVDTRSAEQRAIEASLVEQIQRLLKEGRTPFTGDRVADLTAAERGNISGLSDILQTAGPAFERLLSGEVPEEFFESTIKNPLLKTLREDLIPLAEEGLVSRGTFQGSPLLRTRRKITQNAFDTLAAERGKLAKSAFEAPGKFASQAALTSQVASSVFGQERAVSQAKLDAAFQEFVRTEPGSAEALNAALQFLGIPVFGFVQPSAGTTSSGAGEGIGALVAAITSAFLGQSES